MKSGKYLMILIAGSLAVQGCSKNKRQPIQELTSGTALQTSQNPTTDNSMTTTDLPFVRVTFDTEQMRFGYYSIDADFSSPIRTDSAQVVCQGITYNFTAVASSDPASFSFEMPDAQFNHSLIGTTCQMTATYQGLPVAQTYTLVLKPAIGLDLHYADFDSTSVPGLTKITGEYGNLNSQSLTIQFYCQTYAGDIFLEGNATLASEPTPNQVTIISPNVAPDTHCAFAAQLTSLPNSAIVSVGYMYPPGAPTLTGYAANGTAGGYAYAVLKGQYLTTDIFNHPTMAKGGFTITSSDCIIVPGQTYSYDGPDGAYPTDPTKSQINLAIDTSGHAPGSTFSCTFTVTRTGDGAMTSTTVTGLPTM